MHESPVFRPRSSLIPRLLHGEELVSQATPFPFCSADRFQYALLEVISAVEWKGCGLRDYMREEPGYEANPEVDQNEHFYRPSNRPDTCRYCTVAHLFICTRISNHTELVSRALSLWGHGSSWWCREPSCPHRRGGFQRLCCHTPHRRLCL